MHHGVAIAPRMLPVHAHASRLVYSQTDAGVEAPVKHLGKTRLYTTLAIILNTRLRMHAQ
jgi:hypothetical protein